MVLTSDMVSQSTVYYDPDHPDRRHGPELAIDKDRKTIAHTICQEGQNVWYKIEFGGEHVVNKVVIINSFQNQYKTRMDGTDVAVLSGDKEHICETLRVTSEDSEEE